MKKRIHLDSFHVAGFQYYNGASVWADLELGTKLELTPEPDNRHDENAVAVMYNNSKIGYIPSQRNTILAKLINAGYLRDALELVVQKKDSREHTERQLYVGLFLLEKE